MVEIKGDMYKTFNDIISEHSLEIIPIRPNNVTNKGCYFLADKINNDGLVAVCTTSDITLYTKDEYKIVK